MVLLTSYKVQEHRRISCGSLYRNLIYVSPRFQMVETHSRVLSSPEKSSGSDTILGRTVE